jgi:hypothetical protein
MDKLPCLAAISLAFLSAVPAQGARAAQQATAATADAKETAYMLGIKCYIANGVATGDTRYNADGSQTDQFRASAKKSYDFIWYMGRQIGKSDALIQEDIDSYQAMMPGAFLRDDATFQRVRYECHRIGLM